MDWEPYPSENIALTPSFRDPTDSSAGPFVPLEGSDWHYYEGTIYQVTDDSLIVAIPAFSCGVNQGTVYFDQFVVEEYDENQNFVRRIMFIDIEPVKGIEHTITQIKPFLYDPIWWEPWTPDGGGSHGIVAGHESPIAIAITGGYRCL